MRVLLAVMVAVVFMGGVATAGPIKADIVWVIDDSVSMGGDIAQVKLRIVQFNTAMTNAGIDAHYALVRFGGPNQVFNNYGHNDIASLEQDLVDFATFTAGGSPFSTLTAPTSAFEPGSWGTQVAMNNATFRAGSVRNIILITDEDDDEVAAHGNVNFAPSTYANADALLTAGDALFNFIGRPNFGNSEHSYHKLALDHGGAIFDILAFRANPEAFFENFTETKVKEIIEAAPEPASLALLGLGVLAVARRRRKA